MFDKTSVKILATGEIDNRKNNIIIKGKKITTSLMKLM